MLEKTVKAAVRKRLKELGAYSYWPVPTVWGATAVDILVCYKGRFIAIECKATGRKLLLHQAMTLNAIKAAGGLVFVIDSVEQAQKLLLD